MEKVFEKFQSLTDDDLKKIIAGSFSEAVRENRLRLGLTQRELAQQLFTTKQAVCNWEHNRRVPNLEMLEDISEIFGCSVDQLIKDCERPNAKYTE